MKKWILLVCSILCLSCSISKPIYKEVITYKQIDSIAWHDSTIYIYIPKERIVDIVPSYDTLKLETSVAKAEAFVDTLTHSLKGSIENKKDSIKWNIKWKEKIISKDSLVYKEVPYPVEVPTPYTPKYVYWILGYTAITLIYFGIKLYLKFKI